MLLWCHGYPGVCNTSPQLNAIEISFLWVGIPPSDHFRSFELKNKQTTEQQKKKQPNKKQPPLKMIMSEDYWDITHSTEESQGQVPYNVYMVRGLVLRHDARASLGHLELGPEFGFWHFYI